ncbi:UvrD-helicase domain-containing protein [Crossiella sp. NPDC003009]
MPRLGIAKEFLSGYAKLEKSVQRAVDKALEMFTEQRHAGAHLEKLVGAKDPNIRTIRITKQYRGVVLAPTGGDEYLLLAVLNHDEANAYAVSRKFTVNHAIGVLEVRNQAALEGLQPAFAQLAEQVDERLFGQVKDGELIALGIDPKLLPLIRLLATDTHLDTLESLLPVPQYDALVALASGMTPEEAWHEVSKHLAAEVPAEIDTTNLITAMERTPDQYTTVTGPEELADMLAHPFDVWRVFLHSTQQKIAYRPSYRGPALVSGGAGTGKTVTAVHRAAFLAGRAGSANGQPEILLTTFTRNLATALERQLGLLTSDSQHRARIDVINVDRLAYRVVTEARGRAPEIAGSHALNRRWQQAAKNLDGEFTATFLEREWEQVVLAQNLRRVEDYRTARRRGRGRPLSPMQKERVWAAIGEVLAGLRRDGQQTHLQVVDEAAEILAERGQAPYRHVIVDEGQDLHPAQWRMLRAAVPSGADDLFIVADPNQRIYNNNVSLASLGIGVRGRSHRLTISYRTTQEILSWSVGLLDSQPPTGLDDEPDGLPGYRSPMHGRRPVVHTYPNRAAELDGVTAQVQEWLKAGVEPSAIAVAARTTAQVKDLQAVFDRDGIPAASAKSTVENVVRLCTMHALKGLEFRCAAVIGVAEGVVPAPAAVTDRAEDPVAHQHDLQRERNLLFVACTRARDILYVSHAATPSPFLTTRR